MPVYTLAEAMNKLSSVTTLDQLIELARSVDASVGDSKLILYGGQVGDVQAWQMAKTFTNITSVKWIENTQVTTAWAA